MRNVMRNHDETAHVWAAQTQDSGRAPDGRMFFNGRTLYSYGSHFALGWIARVPAGNVQGLVFLNSDGYSVSTGKHKRITWRATTHYIQHDLPGLTDIVRDLERLGDNPSPDQVAALKRWAYAHSADIMSDAGDALLSLAGLPAGTFAKLAARKVRDDKVKSNAAARTLHKSALEFARKALKEETPRSIRTRDGFVTVTRGTYNYRTSERGPDKVKHSGTLADFYELIRDAHKAAKAEGWSKARVARLWGMVTLARDVLKARGAAGHVANENRHLRAQISIVRQGLKGPDVPVRWTWRAYDMAAASARELAHILPRELPMGQARHDRLELLAADWHAKGLAEREREAAARIEAEREAREAWQRGEAGARFRSADAQGRAYIRAIAVTRDETGAITGGDIETSQGAFVPLTHAVRAFRFLKLCHDRGEGWNANGRTLPVGHYRVSAVEPDGSFVAGCHRIGWSEVERVAVELGIFDAAPDASALVETGGH